MLLRNILGGSRDQERVRSIWRKAAGDTHERVPSSQWEKSVGFILLWVGSGSLEGSWGGSGSSFFPLGLRLSQHLLR